MSSVVSNSSWPHGLQPSGLLYPWNSQARILEQVAISSCRDLPDPGMEPMSPQSPSLAGGFFTTEPPGKSALHVGKSLSYAFFHLRWKQTSCPVAWKVLQTHLCQSSEPTSVTFHALGSPHPGTGQAWSHLTMAEDEKEEEILAKVFFLPT